MVDLVGDGSDNDPSPELDALRRRYGDWWRPTSNTLRTLHRLDAGDLLSEFRRGDIGFVDLDDSLSMNDGKGPPVDGGIVRTLVERMYY